MNFLRQVFYSVFFRAGFYRGFFRKPKPQTPNPKTCAPQPDRAQPVGPGAEKSWLGGSFGGVTGGHVPAQKNELFLAGISQRFSLFFFRKTRELSEKNKKKTRFLNHTSQYRVGVFKKRCFFLIFSRKFLSSDPKK